MLPDLPGSHNHPPFLVVCKFGWSKELGSLGFLSAKHTGSAGRKVNGRPILPAFGENERTAAPNAEFAQYGRLVARMSRPDAPTIGTIPSDERQIRRGPMKERVR
jgi:hypothetical protein